MVVWHLRLIGESYYDTGGSVLIICIAWLSNFLLSNILGTPTRLLIDIVDEGCLTKRALV